MATYEVKVMVEYWVTLEADSEEQAEHDAYYTEVFEECQHTAELYSSKAYLIDDEDDSSTEDENE